MKSMLLIYVVAACSAVAIDNTANGRLLSTSEELKRIFPNCGSKCASYLDSLKSSMIAGKINTCNRQAAFLAQIGHETLNLQFMTELGSDEYFKKYDGRKDLGNTEPGDGARYKGRGAIQLTGRANYREIGRVLGQPFEEQPELVAQEPHCFNVAVDFWNKRGLSSLADENTQDAFDKITRRINGGLNGKTERYLLWLQAKKELGC